MRNMWVLGRVVAVLFHFLSFVEDCYLFDRTHAHTHILSRTQPH